MNFSFPKTREEDYIAFQTALLKINHLLIKGEISDYSASLCYQELAADYSGKLFLEDIFYFDSLEDLTKELESSGVEKATLIDCVNHETRHAQAALELGYEVSYSCVRSYCTIGGKQVVKLISRVGVSSKKRLNTSDLLAIANAVDNPSHLDLQALQTYNQ